MKKLTKWEKESLEKLRKETKLADAFPLLEKIREISKNSPEAKQEFIKSIKSGFESSGNCCLMRAFLEGIMTEEEWIEMRDKFGFSISDIGVVLLAVFGKTEKKDEVAVIVTMPDTTISKHKEFIEKRFKVFVKTPPEIMEELKKENPEKFKEFEEEFKKENETKRRT